MYEEVVTLLGLSEVSEEMQAKLEAIIDIVSRRLCILINADEVPDALSYIVTEVSLIRFNRIGSEGVKQHTVEGESMSWDERDFTPYAKDIEAWLAQQEDPTSSSGRIRFI